MVPDRRAERPRADPAATALSWTRARNPDADHLAEMHAFEATRYVDPATFAGVHASLGEMDEALRWFQKAFDDRSPDMVYARSSSRIMPQLAGSAGYQAIVARMGFPPPEK
jgi:hypothetical protein